MLRAQQAGDAGNAWAAYRRLEALRTELESARVTVAEGVLDPFLNRARTAYESWAGIAQAPAGSDGGTLRLERARVLDTVTVLTEPGTTGSVEVRTEGGAWRRLGALDAQGATELRTGERPVDAVRVVDADPGRVRHVVPWFADVPDAVVELPGDRADADIGRTRTVTVTLGSARPEDVRDRLTADAPEGVDVRVPKQPLSVPRGTPVRVPVEVTVKPGTPTRSYDVRLGFGGAARTLTVDAVPPVEGPDVARTGRARSSADETPDFPASAANDGDAGTRWSSPAEDDAWWQVELDRPVRLGKVDLRWQDAHASAYRVEVSRTAAPGARRRRSTTAAAATRRSAWTSRTSATSASRANSGPRGTGTRCGRWRRTRSRTEPAASRSAYAPVSYARPHGGAAASPARPR